MMKQPDDPAKATFEDLFSRLLSTAAEEHDIKANGGTMTKRIEIGDRLQALRSHLAAIRKRLANETTPRLHDRQPPRYAIEKQSDSPRRAA